MASGEHINQPPFYDELFSGFSSLAALRGNIHHEPLDSQSEPGDDGTLTPDGEQAFGYDYTLEADNLPPAIREMDIDHIKISYYVSAVVDGQVWPERVWIHLHESAGLSKHYGLSNSVSTETQSNTITCTYELEPDVEADLEDDEMIGAGLSDEEMGAIIDGLFNGKTYLLKLDGPAGAFARSAYLNLTRPDKPDADDIDGLRKVLRELNPSS